MASGGGAGAGAALHHPLLILSVICQYWSAAGAGRGRGGARPRPKLSEIIISSLASRSNLSFRPPPPPQTQLYKFPPGGGGERRERGQGEASLLLVVSELAMCLVPGLRLQSTAILIITRPARLGWAGLGGAGQRFLVPHFLCWEWTEVGRGEGLQLSPLYWYSDEVGSSGAALRHGHPHTAPTLLLLVKLPGAGPGRPSIQSSLLLLGRSARFPMQWRCCDEPSGNAGTTILHEEKTC